MDASRIISSPARAPQPAPKVQQPERPKHDPGLIRDVVEKGVGVINAVTRLPESLISGLAIGGYQGARKGADENYTIRPESVATGLVVSNTLQSVAQGAIGGYLLLGPAGALANAAKEAGQASFSTYLFVKGGAAKEMGQEMTDAINKRVESGVGGVEGGFKGAYAGSVSGVKAGAKTGFQEGRAAASGAIEGLKEIPREFKDANSLEGPFWKRVLSAASGVLSAAFAAPAGLAMSLLKGKTGDKDVSAVARIASSAAGGAVIGGLAGSFAGPIGIAIGAGVGATVALLGPTSRASFAEETEKSLLRAKADDGDMGSEVGNNRRDLVQKVITGTVSGVRQGWDSGVSVWQPA